VSGFRCLVKWSEELKANFCSSTDEKGNYKNCKDCFWYKFRKEG